MEGTGVAVFQVIKTGIVSINCFDCSYVDRVILENFAYVAHSLLISQATRYEVYGK